MPRNRVTEFLREWLIPIAFGVVLLAVIVLVMRWYIWWAIAP